MRTLNRDDLLNILYGAAINWITMNGGTDL